MVIGLNSAFIHGKNFLEKSSSGSIPSGVICIWSGASTNIPDGWHLCDGTNNTPDLRDKFVLGSGNKYSVGSTGGEETHALTKNEMPRHSHTYALKYWKANGAEVKVAVGTGMVESADQNFNTGQSGNGNSHNNMPPYYALCFIMKL